jgi:hypothetical protein
MKIKLLLFTTLCLNLSLFAQELPEILRTQEYKRGIYKNFAEFLKNSPSIITQFELTSKANDEEIRNGKAIYLLTGVDSLNVGNDIWGVCEVR